MRILKKLSLMLLALCVATALLAGCGSEPQSEAATEEEIITVQRGDLVIDVVSSGNLALSHKEDLAFEVAGTVEEVLVEEGDVVEEGQVLATLDISEWEDYLEGLEDTATAAERSQLQVQINLHTAEQNLKNSRDNQAAKELALLNAQISLDTAIYNLSNVDGTDSVSDFKVAWAALSEAENHLHDVLLKLTQYEYEDTEGLPGEEFWQKVLVLAQLRLDSAQATLDAMLAGADAEDIAISKLRVEAAEMAYAQAQEDLAEVAQDIALKELQLALAQANLVAAQKALEDAQEALAEAQSESPLITAPFDGFITEVNVEGGDEVLIGTVAVQLADAAKFEADILINEMDILQVKLDGLASVQVDAMSGLSFPAKVTHISPTATIESGVVSYQVKVEMESLVPQESTVSLAQPRVNLDRLYEVLDKAVADGKLTQEEADALRESWEERASDLTQEEVDQGVQGLAQLLQNYSGEQIKQFQERMKQAAEELTEEQKEQLRERYRASSAAVQQQGEFQLREGLTVTVSIIIEERKNVLLVPNKVIIVEGQESFVQVTEDGVIEQRPVQTGLSDWQNTEIIEGLSEGEQAVMPQKTTAPEEPRRRGMFGGG